MVDDGHRHTNFLVLATGTLILGTLGVGLTEAGLTETARMALLLTIVWGGLTGLYMEGVYKTLNGWLESRHSGGSTDG